MASARRRPKSKRELLPYSIRKNANTLGTTDLRSKTYPRKPWRKPLRNLPHRVNQSGQMSESLAQKTVEEGQTSGVHEALPKLANHKARASRTEQTGARILQIKSAASSKSASCHRDDQIPCVRIRCEEPIKIACILMFRPPRSDQRSISEW